MKSRHYAVHKCAPGNRKHVPIVTGDPDFDQAIAKCRNPDVPDRLKTRANAGQAYGTRTAYNGYSGPSYRGDD